MKLRCNRSNGFLTFEQIPSSILFSTLIHQDLQRIYVLRSRLQFYVSHPEDSMLILFVFGEEARRMEKQTDRSIVDDIVASLLVCRWPEDPFSRGSYSSFHRATDRRLLQDLARLERRTGKEFIGQENTPIINEPSDTSIGKQDAEKRHFRLILFLDQ